MLSASVRREVSVLAYGLGLQLGALISVLAVLVVGWPVQNLLGPSSGWWLAGAVIVVLTLRELHFLRFSLPENRRLVPITVFRFGPFWGALQFGIEMGSGARTYVTSSLPYAVLLTAILVGGPWSVILAGVGFALGRFLMVIVSLRSGDLTTWHPRFIRSTATRVSLVALFCVGAVGAYLSATG